MTQRFGPIGATAYLNPAAARLQYHRGPVSEGHSPDAANVLATYAGVVVKGSNKADSAHAFLDWLKGPEGQAILAKFGFLPPPDG